AASRAGSSRSQTGQSCLTRATSSVAIAPRTLSAFPPRRALLPEGPYALAHVLRAEALLAQRDELALDVRIELALGTQQLADHPLVAAQRQRRVAGQLGRQVQGGLLELRLGDDAVDQAPAERGGRVDVAPEQEQLARARRADRV